MLLCNKWKSTTEFYQFYQAEAAIRTLASANRNIYVISLFACCRQKYDRDSPDMSKLINIDETDPKNADNFAKMKTLCEKFNDLNVLKKELLNDDKKEEELTAEE